jgi:hypothetical protein
MRKKELLLKISKEIKLILNEMENFFDSKNSKEFEKKSEELNKKVENLIKLKP